MTSKGNQFRALHEQDKAFIIPNPWDPGTARILSTLGFKALATTSAGLAFSMGVCEGQVSRQQVLNHCQAIVDATDLPVSADLEKGFEDSPEGVAKTIELAAQTGLAGGSIEDYSGRAGQPIFDFGLAVERIEAAVEAARAVAGDFVLTARCENFLWGRRDLDDTIKRLQAFDDAGADVLYAPGLDDLDSIQTVCASVSKPVNVVMGLPGATFGVKELEQAGVRRISVGSALARLSYGVFVDAAKEMADRGEFSFSDRAMGFEELEDMFRT